MPCSCSGNRAECALRLGDFEKALADAQTSLDLDKTNAKSQARKTRAEEAIAEAAAEKDAADKKRAALVSPQPETLCAGYFQETSVGMRVCSHGTLV